MFQLHHLLLLAFSFFSFGASAQCVHDMCLQTTSPPGDCQIPPLLADLTLETNTTDTTLIEGPLESTPTSSLESTSFRPRSLDPSTLRHQRQKRDPTTGLDTRGQGICFYPTGSLNSKMALNKPNKLWGLPAGTYSFNYQIDIINGPYSLGRG